jgi:hypothetical protein
MTPKGVTKTICVSDNAIPGIENAAEHSDRVMIAPECPCLDVWDGYPYPQETTHNGTVPPIPQTFEAANCHEITDDEDALVDANVEVDGSNLTRIIYLAIAGVTGEDRADVCSVLAWDDVEEEVVGEAFVVTDGVPLFPQEVPSDGVINDPGLQACKDLLAARGCDFGG